MLLSRFPDWITSLLSKVAAQFKLQEALTVIHTGESERTPCPGFWVCVFFVVVA